MVIICMMKFRVMVGYILPVIGVMTRIHLVLGWRL